MCFAACLERGLAHLLGTSQVQRVAKKNTYSANGERDICERKQVSLIRGIDESVRLEHAARGSREGLDSASALGDRHNLTVVRACVCACVCVRA